MHNNSYAWCLRCIIFSARFLDIRIYQLVSNEPFSIVGSWCLPRPQPFVDG